MKKRVILLVSAVWILIGVVWGTQNAIGGSLQGDPVPLWTALRGTLVQSLPWIPITLGVIWLTVRFPLTRPGWKRNVWVHALAVPVVTFAANVLVVLGFWTTRASFGSFATLIGQGAFWAALRLHVGALLYAAIAAITLGVLYYRDSRARELHLARVEGQLAQARLQALNAQIRPHFLFNTLHTIGQLWRSGRHTDADAMLDHLGFLFQKVQASTSRPEVRLEDELTMVREYLAIEETRFSDRLRARVEATDAARRCRVPPLILQPLVENAIRHGISKSVSGGSVEVTARVEHGYLWLTVGDDGPGMNAPDDAEKGAANGSGTGLRNTRARLEQLYGLEAKLEVTSPHATGTVVRMRIPARYDGTIDEEGPHA